MSKEIKLAGEEAVGEWLGGASTTRGFLADDGDLLSPPRFKVLAPLSRQVKDDLGKDGQIWSDAHSDVIGGVVKKKPLTVDAVSFIPIAWQRSWAAFDDEMNLVWQTQDPDDAVFAQHEIGDDDKWRYKRLMLLALMPVNHKDHEPEIGIMVFGSTAYKRGRRLYRDMRMKRLKGKSVPLFAQVWTMGIDVDKNAKGEWFAPDCRFAGIVGPEDFQRFSDMADEYAHVVFAADAGEEEEGAVPTVATDEPPF